MNSNVSRLLAVGMMLAPLTAQGDDYFVRANMPGYGLVVDGATSIEAVRTPPGGRAFGSANLAEGTLRVVSNNADTQNTLTSWVEFGDTINILGVTDAATVTLQMRVTGTISGVVPLVFSWLQIGDAFACTTVICPLVRPGPREQAQWTSQNTSTVDRTFSIEVPVSATDSSFVFLAGLLSHVNGPDGFVDFGNTARLSLILPDGLTFESGSGVLLTSPVPEPGAFVLLSTGLAVVVAGVRRRRGNRVLVAPQ